MMGIVLLVIVILVIAAVVGIYNGLVKGRNRVKNSFAQIDVQLKRRYDLIPNLVETAKGYIKHERETLEAVTKARGLAFSAAKAASLDPSSAQAIQSLSAAESQLTGALGRLMVVVEQYPDLKADKTMLTLMEELSSTENRIAFARQAYNDAVMDYNNRRETFPAVIFSGAFGFKESAMFEIEDKKEKEAPKVAFS
ncbi:MAG: LemA family protein [Thermodesulfobacteriota bacterium]